MGRKVGRKVGQKMTRRFDVIALGELLIDFTESGLSVQGNPLYEANPGGAPCNVLAMLQKLGWKCAFVGKVGADFFGRQLREVAEQAGICTDYLVMDSACPTTLAFVKTLPGGDRDFSFYRDPGADMRLTEKEVPEEAIAASRIFHFGSLSLTHESVRRATVKALDCAEANGVLISFDPNLRPPLWDSMEDAKEQIAYGLSRCDILKIADNELLFMTGEKDFDAGAAILQERYPNIRLLNVTAGPEGSYAYYKDIHVYQPGFQLGGTIETTGAGDTFCACVLHHVLHGGLDDLTPDSIAAMLRFANAAAYLVTTRKGAIRSMPERTEVDAILYRYKSL